MENAAKEQDQSLRMLRPFQKIVSESVEKQWDVVFTLHRGLHCFHFS